MPATSVFLAWGKVTHPETALAREGAEVAGRGDGLGRQVGLIGPDTDAFRLNSPGAFRIDPELVAALPDRAGLRTLCRDRLEATVPSFAARARRWIAEYLEALDAAFPLPDGDGQVIEDPSDRFFAGLLPLTAPHIVPLERDGTLREGAEFVPFDLAFWDGAHLIAVLFGGENRSTPGRRVAVADLADRVGARLAVRRIDTAADETELLRDMLARAQDAQPPWFGPYRAGEFRAQLPQE